MSLNLTDDKSTLVQVMAWCRQATSHYLSQCWPRYMHSVVQIRHSPWKWSRSLLVITGTSWWARRCLKLPASRSFAQPFFQVQIKQTSKPRVSGLCEGIPRWPMKSPHKGPVTRKKFPFDDGIMAVDATRIPSQYKKFFPGMGISITKIILSLQWESLYW